MSTSDSHDASAAMTDAASSSQKAARTAPSVPETPAMRQGRALIDALNSHDTSVLPAFVRGQFGDSVLGEFPAERSIDFLSQFARRSGEVRLVRVLDASDLRVRLLIRGRKSAKESVLFLRVAAGSPFKIEGIGIIDAQPWDTLPLPDVPAGKPTPARIPRYLDSFLTPLVKADAFSGAVLVAKDGKIVYKKAFGLASRAWNAPNRVDTRFNLGSMNKMFTAVAIAQLAEQNKLGWDDPLAKSLPDWPNSDAAQKVHLSHLLSHTSGIADYFNEDFGRSSRDRFRTISDYLPLYASKPLAFEPGARYEYSNGGFMTLGAVVQKVSGVDYFRYIRENIYQKAQMRSSDSFDLDDDVPNLATGYSYLRSLDGAEATAGPRTRYSNIYLHVIKGGPAGGGYSTVDDLLHFDQALRTGKLIRKETFERLILGNDPTASGPTPDRRGYGFGFQTEWRNGQRIVGHSGGFPGINSILDMYLDSGWTVVVMCNYDEGANIVSDRLKNWLTR